MGAVGCGQLSRIALHCPALDALRLDDCAELVAASLKPVGMRTVSMGARRVCFSCVSVSHVTRYDSCFT